MTAEVLRRSELVTTRIVYLDDFGGSIGPVPDHSRMDQVVAVVESFGWALAPGRLRATAEFGLKNHKAVRVRGVCQLVGQAPPLQLSLGPVCRLRSRYLLLTTCDAARAQT